MKAQDIKKVLIIGAGTMGRSIAVQCALFGCEVVVYDYKEEVLQEAQKGVVTYLEDLIQQGFVSQSKAEQVKKIISYTIDPVEASTGIDLVSESVYEDIEVKNQVWKMFGELLPEHAILTTNTSSLLPSQFAEASGHPGRFLAWHFHQPFFKNLADVMPHAGTNYEVAQTVLEFSERIQQTTIFVEKEIRGYVFNSMLIAFEMAALKLLANGVTSIEAVDRAWMVVRQSALGPCGIMDFVGIDTVCHIVKNLPQQNDENRGIIQMLESMIEKNELGVKTGKGFYTYPNPAFEQEGFVKLPSPVK